LEWTGKQPFPVPSSENLADIFTKPLGRIARRRACAMLRLCEDTEGSRGAEGDEDAEGSGGVEGDEDTERVEPGGVL
jgi:hypothetical protein